MPRFHRKPIAVAVLMMFGSPEISGAQTGPGPEKTLDEVRVKAAPANAEYRNDTTTTGTRVETPLRDIPQSITIINRAVMDAQGAASLADVLRNVPGITLGAAEGGTIGNNINLRGFSARTDLYLDGVRDRGQYYRDVFSLESVEVLKGPSSMLFGRGSTGGVINQVSKTPDLNPKNEVSVTTGTQPSLRATADFNKPLSDTSAMRVELMAQDVNSTRDVMENKDFGIAPSLRFGIGTPTEVMLSGLLLHNNDMPDYGLPPVNGHPASVDRHNFYGLTDDHTVQDVGEVSLRIKHKIDPAMTLRNQTQYIHAKTNARESGPNNIGTVAASVYTQLPGGNASGNITGLPSGQLFVGIGSHDRLIKDSSLYNQTDLISEIKTGSWKHALLLGVELGRDTYSNQAYARTDPALLFGVGTNPLVAVVPLVNPVYLPTSPTVRTTVGNLANSSATTIAPYVNDTIELNSRWKVVGGLRWDRYDAKIDQTVTLPQVASQTINYTSVRAGVIYQPTEVQSYYVSYGTSFNPSLETLTVTSGTQALPPEETRSYEAGLKWDLMGGDLSFTSALFQAEKTNARSQVSAGVFQLTGDVRVNGFELGMAGRITPKWQVLAGYTYLDAKIVQASALDGTLGKVPANTPRDSASLWTTYNLTREWEMGGGAVYMSDRYANNTNVVSVGDYLRFDATLAYHQPKYDVRLNLLNLGNRRNYELLIPSDGGRSVPGIDRTALLTYTYKF